ncbi:MAG: DUF6311 domain-containing protein [Acetobacteraceae bacterium]
MTHERRDAWLAYLSAALLGAATAASLLPADFVLPPPEPPWRSLGDIAQHIVAQRVFIAEPWGWPLLAARGLGEGGTNIALADGIPLLALPLKAVGGLLAPGFHGIGLWHALVMVLQPLAAVFALRAAGVGGIAPAVAVSAASLAMPAWLARHGHAALMGHWTILLALGVMLRAVRHPSRPCWVGAVALATASLLVHPYLAAMVLALLGAAPATLLLRRDRGWALAAAGVAASAAAVGLCLVGLGYLGAAGDGGYGNYALNLISPLWPARSAFFPHVTREIDATGFGGWEGYNWLGAGLIGGLALLLARDRAGLSAALRRHPGLVLVLSALTALSVSHRIGLGGTVVLDLGPAPAPLEQFRSSGRFFWPVAYALLIGAFALIARLPRVGPTVAVLLAAVQVIDAAPNRSALADWAARRPPWTVEAAALRPLIREAERVTILPSWPCIPAEGHATRERVQELLLLVSERAVPVNTMQLARWRDPPRCTDAEVRRSPPSPGELRLVLPEARDPSGGAGVCLEIGDLLVCRGF